MSWSYSGQPATNASDAVRFLIGDTDPARPLVTDEEIAYAMGQHAHPHRAAALLCDTLDARGGGVQSERLGDLAVTYAAWNGSGAYSAMAARLRRQADAGAVPVAGGISVAGKDAATGDTDRVPPYFTRETASVPGTEPPIGGGR